MKELYTSPEANLTYFISQERLAVIYEQEVQGEVLFGSIAQTQTNDITFDF